jgi:hypothetical protein
MRLAKFVNFRALRSVWDGVCPTPSRDLLTLHASGEFGPLICGFAVISFSRTRHQTTDKCHASTPRKVTRFSARGFAHRIAIRFVEIRKSGVIG